MCAPHLRVDLFLIIMDIVNAALPPLIDLFDALAPIFTDLLPVLRELLEPLMVPLTDVLQVLADNLAPLVDTLVPALVNIFTVLGEPLVDVLIILLRLVEIALPPLIFLLELLIPIVEFVAMMFAVVPLLLLLPLTFAGCQRHMKALAAVDDTAGPHSLAQCPLLLTPGYILGPSSFKNIPRCDSAAACCAACSTDSSCAAFTYLHQQTMSKVH